MATPKPPTNDELRAKYRIRLGAIADELNGIPWGPNVSEQGRNVDLVGYRNSLLAEQKMLQEQLAELQKTDGPFEFWG